VTKLEDISDNELDWLHRASQSRVQAFLLPRAVADRLKSLGLAEGQDDAVLVTSEGRKLLMTASGRRYLSSTK
jgi:hypothetical protein